MIKEVSLYSSKWEIMCISRSHPLNVCKDFGIRGKLAPRYIGPYETIEACGPVA
jgi:hypothetical protein